MLYRVETGLHAGLDDTQGRKTAQHLLKALNLSTGSVRQIKVFTAEGLSEAQVRRLLDEGIWHDPILQAASLEPLPAGQPEPDWYVEVGFRPGVTDNEGRTARDTLALVPAGERGTSGLIVGASKRTLIPFNTVHLPERFTIKADEIQGIRAFGTRTELQSVQDVVNKRLAKARRQLDATHEFQRMGALNGQVLDAAGVKSLSTMPNREGLLSMLAGSLNGIVGGLAVALQGIVDKQDETAA